MTKYTKLQKIKKISVKPQRPFCGFTSICIVSHFDFTVHPVESHITSFSPVLRLTFAAIAAYIAAVAAYIAAAGFFTTFSIFTITELRRMFVTDSTTKFSPTIPKIR